MIYKICPRCGSKIPAGDTCKKCRRVWDKPEGVRTKYHTGRWAKLRAAVIAKAGNKDLLAWHQGRLVPADIVHHIVPADEEPEKFYDPANLIPLSRVSHDAVHEAYREGEESKRAMQKLLSSLVISGAEAPGGLKK